LSENKQPVIQDENSIILERRAKLQELREKGVAFPISLLQMLLQKYYIRIMTGLKKKP